MPVLAIQLLGGFAVLRAGRMLDAADTVRFESDKVRGLLAYLALEGREPQRREALAGLLWPDKDEARARHSLNQALHNLRRVLDTPDEAPFLVGDKHNLELNPALDLSTDVEAFQVALAACRRHGHEALAACEVCRQTLTDAATLYRGSLLAGFSLTDSAAFEEWLALRRAQLEREAVETLRRLAGCGETQGRLEEALAAARRWAELAPWQEAAHQRVMRLLALTGHRSEALAYYETCSRLLRVEIGVEPRPGTRALAADIRAGRVRGVQPEAELRPLLLERREVQPAEVRLLRRSRTSNPFVGREAQLAELHGRLGRALAGEGQIMFVAGEAGAGKTALLRRFAREAQVRHPALLAAWGQGNAFAGSGDPYLPFRQVLGLLTGEARRGYEMGLLDEMQAQRLWETLPLAVDALVGRAPDLVDVLASGEELLARAAAAVEGEPDWLAALRTVVERGRGRGMLRRGQLQEQTAAFLAGLAGRRPLLVLLDDLHWVDAESVSLLYHLAQGLAGVRLLVVGAYRPEEVDVSREGKPHPLRFLVAECKRLTGVQPLNLNRLNEGERRAFVGELVDAEPNELGAAFREALFAHTEGHALFTVEMLAEFAERGVIAWEEGRGWLQRRAPDWGEAPMRAEGMIEARLGRLAPDLLGLLGVASVEGETFLVQTVAAALGRAPEQVTALLSGELDRVHGLVAEAGSATVAGERLDRFRFRHSLFRQATYERLGEAERRQRHGQVAAILEKLYFAQAREIAPQLALHFDLAGEGERALTYYLAAGDQARLLYADGQALAAYGRALALAEAAGDGAQAAAIHMRLGLTHHERMAYEESQAAYAEGFRLWSQTEAANGRTGGAAEQPLRIVWGLAPRNVEPTFDHIPDLFSGLVEETPDLSIVPDVAHRWEIKDGGRTYVFHLRDDVRWSDGEPVTAHDFAYAWRHGPSRALARGDPLYDIKGGKILDRGIAADLKQAGLEVPDPYTLVVKLVQPAVYFLHLLSHPLAGPVPRHMVAHWGDAWATPSHVVSNGPFLLERWDAAGDVMHFVRNPAYHGRSAGNLGQVEALYFRQPVGWQTYLELYEQDRIDILTLLNWTREGFAWARRRHPDEYWQYPLFTTYINCFDTRRPPFDDARVRQALAMTFDREQTTILGGADITKPPYGGFIPPGMPGHSPAIGLPYDPERARWLLAEAGYPGGRGCPPVEMLQFYTPDCDVVTHYQASHWLQQLGITVNHRSLEWTAYWRSISQESPHLMGMNGGPTYGDPDAYLRQAFRTTQTLTGWSHPDYERLIDQAGRTQSQGERLQLYQQADALLMQEAPLFPARYHDNAYLAKPRVRLYPSSPLGGGGYWKDVLLAPRAGAG